MKVLGDINRVPGELEDEIDEVVETEEKPDGRENERGISWRGYEGVLGVEGDINPKL